MDRGYVWRSKAVFNTVADGRDPRGAMIAFALFTLSETATWVAIVDEPIERNRT